MAMLCVQMILLMNLLSFRTQMYDYKTNIFITYILPEDISIEHAQTFHK